MLDPKGYKEYSVLKEVIEFLKRGNNGNEDLFKWFEEQKKFRNYVSDRSPKAKESRTILDKQMRNYARSFSSSKISLLRELGLIRNKRNDYQLIGAL
jgi:hypothetical protein